MEIELKEGKDIGDAPLNKLIAIDFNSGKTRMEGILLSRNKDWSLFLDVVGDYVIDGFALVNNKHIRKWQRDEKEIFTEKVIKAKGYSSVLPFTIEHLDTQQIFEQLQKELLVSVDVYRNDVIFVGKIVEIKAKSIVLKQINTKGLWLETESYTYQSIWIVKIGTDYSNSLTAYMKEYNLY